MEDKEETESGGGAERALSCYDVKPEVTSELATHTSPCQGGRRGHEPQAALDPETQSDGI